MVGGMGRAATTRPRTGDVGVEGVDSGVPASPTAEPAWPTFDTDLDRSEHAVAPVPPARMQVVRCVLIGLTDEEIADALKVAVARVRWIRASMQEAETLGLVAGIQKEMQVRTVLLAEKAQRKMFDLLECGDPTVQRLAAADALDRCPATSKSERSFVAGRIEHTVPPEILSALTDVLRETQPRPAITVVPTAEST